VLLVQNPERLEVPSELMQRGALPPSLLTASTSSPVTLYGAGGVHVPNAVGWFGGRSRRRCGLTE
jgi:hypothetical protein